MEAEFNIEPLMVYLTSVITPTQLADLLDALEHDYLKMMVHLQMLQDEAIGVYEEADSYILHLNELQHVLRKCVTEK